MMHSPTRFGLMRHAPTVWNLQKRIQGIEDTDLTDDGRDLAKRWGRRLAGYTWDRILTSDLGRARQTAHLVNAALGVPILAVPEFREMDWGLWTGMTLKAVKSVYGDQLAELEKDGWQFRPPEGESRYAVWQRARAGLLKAAAAWPGQTILVVAHEGVIKALVYGLRRRAYLPTETPILKSGFLHWLESCQGTLSLKSLNALALNRLALESDGLGADDGLPMQD